MTETRLPIGNVVFDRELYPRRSSSNQLIDRYRRVIDRLPPVLLSSHESAKNVLVNGYHTFQAHRLEGAEDLPVEYVEIPRDQIKVEAAKRNATDGWQLDDESKQDLAREWFVPNGSGSGNIAEIAEILSVHPETVRAWTRGLREQAKDDRDRRIIELWHDGANSLRDIADEADVSLGTVHKIVDAFKNKSALGNEHPGHFTDVWTFAGCDKRFGHEYPGRIPGQLVEHVLFYYTDVGDTVCDPFAGSGTTVDVCLAMGRRYLAYDVRPVRDEIREHDVTSGFPAAAKGCDMIFMDPPYWSMKDGEYPDGSISRLDLDAYREAVSTIAGFAAETVRPGGIVCWLVQNQTAENIPDGSHYLDHAFEAYGRFAAVGLEPVRRISCPLTTQTLQPQAVTHHKENGTMAGLVRDLMVFRRPA